MKIAFFIEGNSTFYPNRLSPDRTEFAWAVALNAIMIGYNAVDKINEKFDLGIIIIPKKDPKVPIKKIKSVCKKTCVMQEGPNWYYQDYNIETQLWYLNLINDEVDFILCHNEFDANYYSGISNKMVFPLRSLMIIPNEPLAKQKQFSNRVVIGGNMVSWYGGMDSYIVAKKSDMKIFSPSMGRKQDGETFFHPKEISYIPYVNFKDWIDFLNGTYVGVHMMRTKAAGTFMMNCSFHGIPCIGYGGVDTMNYLHPSLCVNDGDIKTASNLMLKLSNKLKEDKILKLNKVLLTSQTFF